MGTRSLVPLGGAARVGRLLLVLATAGSLGASRAGAVEPVLTTGRYGTFAVRADGTLWSWGIDGAWRGAGSYDMPTGRLVARPEQLGSDNDWLTVSTNGYWHTMALKQDGTLWGWGSPRSAIGTTAPDPNPARPGVYPEPVQVGTDTDWQSVVAADFGSAAIKKDGSLWAWGSLYRDLAPGEPLVVVPRRLGIDNDWASLAAGPRHVLALKKDGTLWAWGFAPEGQLGTGTTERNVPTQVWGGGRWTAVATGVTHTLAVRSDGTLWGWGLAGVLGFDDFGSRLTPVQIHADPVWAAVAASDYHSLAVRRDGTLWARGDNQQAQCGIMPRWIPGGFAQIGEQRDWKSVVAGRSTGSSFALRGNGEFYAWGSNARGVLGTSASAIQTRPVRVSSGWKSVDGGDSTAVGVKRSGTLWSWGKRTDLYAVRGVGDPMDYASPQLLRPGETWLAATVGIVHAVALRADGTLWSWGMNYEGELGRGVGAPGNGDPNPGRVGRDTDWQVASAGYAHTLALKQDGSLWAWGRNVEGQLGVGFDVVRGVPHARPLRVGTDRDWTAVAAGMYVSAGLRADGSLWVWGGYATAVPTLIGGSRRWKRIRAEYRRITAVRDDGTIWQVYAHPSTHRFSLQRVEAGTTWVAAASEDGSLTALRSDGTLWAWGKNGGGRLGLGTDGDVATPQQIGEDADWRDIAVGTNSFNAAFAFGLKADDSLWAWGANYYGQTGTGVFGFGPEPQRIFGPAMNTASFAADTDLAEAGQPVALSWATAATACAIDPGGTAVEATGSVSVTPEQTSGYTLTCREDNLGEREQARVVVLVNEARGGSFESGAPWPDGWTAANAGAGDGSTAAFASAGARSFTFAGSPAAKRLTRVLEATGAAGTAFVLSGWSRSRGLLQSGGVYALEARVRYADGTARTFQVPFPRNSNPWRYRQRAFVVEKDFTAIEVWLRFEAQQGRAWFDDVRLIRR